MDKLEKLFDAYSEMLFMPVWTKKTFMIRSQSPEMKDIIIGECKCENPDIGLELFDNTISIITRNEFISNGKHYGHTLLSRFKYCHDCGCKIEEI